MRAAMEAGIEIPKLCATDMLDAFGSCRLCLVEIEGRARHAGLLHHAGRRGHGGAHPDASGSPHPQGRDGALHLRPPAGLPDLRGQRQLRAAGHGRRGRPARGALRLRRRRTISQCRASTSPIPYFTFDPAKCIVCSRCVRACEEVQGTFALTIAGRGFDSKVAAGMDETFLDSECVSCGACVQACPTATLIEKSVDRDRPAGAFAWSPPAPIAASAAPSRRRCGATKSCAWCRTRTARPTTAIPASRAASPGATPTTRTASSSR